MSEREPERREEGEGGEKPSPVQRLLEALGIQRDEARPGVHGRIVSPVSIEKLIDVIGESIVAEREEREPGKALSRVKAVTAIVHALTKEFIQLYEKDGLGRIYHPIYGRPTIESRLGLLSRILARTIKEVWMHVARAFESGDMNPKDLAEYVIEAQHTTELAYLVLVEVYNQLSILYYINAPPNARPPLVNAALGYEIV